MKKLLGFLDGKKTYIVVAVAILFNTAVQLGYVQASDVQYVNMVLAALGLAALRAGVNKS